MKIINWFINSSVNKQALSLTLKGLIPFLVLMGIDSQFLDQYTNSIVDMIVSIGQLLTLATTVYGFTRKLVLSLKNRL